MRVSWREYAWLAKSIFGSGDEKEAGQAPVRPTMFAILRRGPPGTGARTTEGAPASPTAELRVTYSEPFSKEGVWKTRVGDVGTYPISVVASDGTLSTKETFTLTVKFLNTAPVMKSIPNITVDEGDMVKLMPEVKDREDDPITITYSGWMNTSSRQTTFDDAYPQQCQTRGCTATYKVLVTISDGTFTVTQDVYVNIKDKNRPPVFVWNQ